MKIGFDAKRAYHNNTGLGNYSRDVIRGLVHHFPEHQYFYLNPKKSDSHQLPKEGKQISPQGIDATFPSLWRSKGMVGAIKKEKLDIYHGLSAELPKGIKEKTSCKSVVTIHDLIFKRFPDYYSFSDRKVHDAKVKYALQKADLVIAISEQTKKDIVEFYDFPADRIEVVYQTCHKAFKTDLSPAYKMKVAEKYNLPFKYALNVGTVEPRKNLLNLIKAISELDVPLIVVGNQKGKYASQVNTFIKDTHLENKIRFIKPDSVNDLASIYRLASVFCYPSLFEGFGIPIIESLYSGTPVVTSKEGCFSEAAGDGALYVNPESVSDIYDAISRVISDDTLSEKLVKKGQKHVQKFDDQVISERLNMLYTSLL